MVGGCTAIVTLSHRDYRVGVGRDEQFHCLPLYTIKGTQAELDALVAKG